MNKNIFIFVLVIIALSFIYQEVEITGHIVYYTGDSFESEGKTVTIEKISESNAVISVDGVKNIIGVGDHKDINGIDIKVISVFFVDEPEARNVDLVINVLELTRCGDGKCQDNENSKNCCIDCSCQTNYRCEDNECVYGIPSECRKHEDCDDENPETTDLCVDFNPKMCKHFIEPEEELEELGYEIGEDGEIEDLIEENGEEKQGFFSKIMIFFKGLFGS